MICQEKSLVPDLCNLKCVQGTCRYIDGKPKCLCKNDYDGELCDHYICSEYCANGGQCYFVFKTNTVRERKCNCRPGFTGNLCEVSLDNCKVI